MDVEGEGSGGSAASLADERVTLEDMSIHSVRPTVGGNVSSELKFIKVGG